jgi:hypothetical protein
VKTLQDFISHLGSSSLLAAWALRLASATDAGPGGPFPRHRLWLPFVCRYQDRGAASAVSLAAGSSGLSQGQLGGGNGGRGLSFGSSPTEQYIQNDLYAVTDWQSWIDLLFFG